MKLVRRRWAWIAGLGTIVAVAALGPALITPASKDAAARLPAPGASDHPLVQAVQAAAMAQLEIGTAPGLAIAIVEDGTVVHGEGLGWANEKARRPLTASTPINVASISKSIAAWGFLRFCELEELSLDAAVPPLVPGFSLPGSRTFDADEVTVRRVLSHTAGLSTPSAPVFPASRSLPALESVLARGTGGVPRLELFMPPGLTFSYSGGGYLFLQLALEKTAGESFHRFMTREVLVPAGMESSSFRLTEAMRAAAATYYQGKRRERATYHLPGAAGGLYSTAQDMGRWLALYGDATARSKILSEDEFRELLEPQMPMSFEGVDTRGARYALGHVVWNSSQGTSYVLHAGGNPGLRAFYFVSPATGNGMFMFVNHDDGEVVFHDLIEAWARHYGVVPPPLF